MAACETRTRTRGSEPGPQIHRTEHRELAGTPALAPRPSHTRPPLPIHPPRPSQAPHNPIPPRVLSTASASTTGRKGRGGGHEGQRGGGHPPAGPGDAATRRTMPCPPPSPPPHLPPTPPLPLTPLPSLHSSPSISPRNGSITVGTTRGKSVPLWSSNVCCSRRRDLCQNVVSQRLRLVDSKHF